MTNERKWILMPVGKTDSLFGRGIFYRPQLEPAFIPSLSITSSSGLIEANTSGLRGFQDALKNPLYPRTEELELLVSNEVALEAARKRGFFIRKPLEATPLQAQDVAATSHEDLVETAKLPRLSVFSRAWERLTSAKEKIASKFNRGDKEESYTEKRRREERMDKIFTTLGLTTSAIAIAGLTALCAITTRNHIQWGSIYGEGGRLISPQTKQGLALRTKDPEGSSVSLTVDRNNTSIWLKDLNVYIPNFRILDPNKDSDIYNIPEKAERQAQPQPPLVISPDSINRALTVPTFPEDDETIKLLRYYLDFNPSLVNLLPKTEAVYPTRGPENIKLKAENADMLQWFQGEWVRAYKSANSRLYPNGATFDMFSPEDIELRESIVKKGDYQTAEILFIAHQLTLQADATYPHRGLVRGFQVGKDRRRINGIVVKADEPGIKYSVLSAKALYHYLNPHLSQT